MLFVVFGSSAAGKSYVLDELRKRAIASLVMHDFDEIGVPSDADTAWRHQATEGWLRRGLDYQASGVDLMLVGQSPLGEILAAPSARRYEAISACLIDCADQVREARLRQRGADRLERAGGSVEDYGKWAAWMRGHASDPTWMPEVIRVNDPSTTMCWDRWSNWEAGDPRWQVLTIDTSTLHVGDVADRLVQWVEQERSRFTAGTHPLAASLW